MKKFLFTLAALMMMGTAYADDYLYIEDFEVTPEFLAGSDLFKDLTVKAHFDAYTSAWQVWVNCPEGISPIMGEALPAMTISGYNRMGRAVDHIVALMQNEAFPEKYIAASTEADYQMIDGTNTSVGAAKWAPGEYDMFTLWVEFSPDFTGGDITVVTEPSVSGSDPRGECCPDGQHHEKVCHVTVKGEQPQTAEAPVITFAPDNSGVMVTIENYTECSVKVDGVEVSTEVPYYVAKVYDAEQVVEVYAKNAPEGFEAAEATDSYTLGEKQKEQTSKPSVTYSAENGELTVWAYGSTEDNVEYTLYCDGEVYTGEMPIEYDIYAGYNHVWTATALAPNCTVSEMSDECPIVIEAVTPTYVTPDPVITVADDEEAQTVTITVTGEGTVTMKVTKVSDDPAVPGEVVYETTGESPLTYEIPYGEAEAYYSVYATATADKTGYDVTPGDATEPFVVVPAKPEIDTTLDGELVISEVNQDNGQFTVTYTGDEDVTITINQDFEVVRAAAKTYQLPAYGTYEVIATASAPGYDAITEPATLVWEEPAPVETTTFVKVTSADELVAGKKYIIVAGNKAMGVAATGNFLTAIDITAGDEVEVGNDVAIMTLGGTLGHYTLALDDQYLHAVNSTNLDFGGATEWAISDYNGTLAGYRVKHADYNRSVRYASGYNRFGNYSNSDQNSEYGWIYVEKSETPALQDLTGEIVVSQPDENGVVTVTYTGDEDVTIIVNGEPVAESYQLEDGVPMTFNVTVSAQGYNDLTAEETRTWTAPVLPTLGGYFVWSTLDGEGHFTVDYRNFDYDGPYTLVVKDEDGNVMNPEVGDAGEYYQAAEGTHTYTVEVTAPGYQVKTDTHEYTYTVPTYAPAPILSWNEETFTMTAYLDNREYTNDDIELYMNNEKVENPKTVAQTYQPQVLEFKARTIGKDGDENSEWVYKNVTVPAKEKTASAEPTISVAEGDDAYVITGNGTGTVVMYDAEGNEIENPYTVVRTDETQIIIITVENTDADTDEVMYKPTSKTFTVTVPAKEPEVTEVGAPTMQGYTEDGITGYGVNISPTTAGSQIMYQVYVWDNEANDWVLLKDWTLYEGTEHEIWYTEVNNKYKVVAYAFIGDVKSNEISQEFTVQKPQDPTSIDEMNAGKTIAGVRYFNMAGQEMQEANGMTIVVTTYTDGTTSAVKVMK